MNRAKFDLVVIYDAASTVVTPPIANLVRAIFETEFIHSLKRPPVLLVGGLAAWKQEVGDMGVMKSISLGGEAVVVNGVKERPPEAATSASSIVPEYPNANAPPDPHARWVPSSRPRGGTPDFVVPGLKERSRTYYPIQPPARFVEHAWISWLIFNILSVLFHQSMVTLKAIPHDG